MSRRKPSDRLTPEDFSRTAVWTYDSGRAAQDADEPWVRPAKAGDSLDDEIYVRATLTDRDGKLVPRSVLTLRPGSKKGSKPVATALVVLSPYSASPIEGETLSPTASAAILRLLPIKWEVDVKVGTTRLRGDGKIVERKMGVITPVDTAAEARRQALIEEALARRTAELATQAAAPAKVEAAKKPVTKAEKKPVAKAATKKPVGGKKKR
jgi:hypothetical protein